MAYTKKGWKNKGETGATESNSKLDKNAMNDLEKRIADGFEFKNVTQDNTNLNDYVTTGFYFFEGNKTPINIPIGVNGWLQVIKGNGNFVKQIWYRAGTKNVNDFETYIRTKTDNWSEWKKLFIEDTFYHQSGDQFTVGGYYSATFTSSNTEVQFTVTTPKWLDKVSNATIEGIITIRHADGGYIANAVSIESIGTVSMRYKRGNQLSFGLKLKTPATNFTNNSVLALVLQDCKITFS